MKKQTIFFLSIIIAVISFSTPFMSSCKRTTTSVDSGTFYFHLHTNIGDSTIGGNPGPDSNTTYGSTRRWFYDHDTAGRLLLLTVPQFFVSNITLVNANGSLYNFPNAVLLKGLDSEDYYVGKAPIGIYTAAYFTVGLSVAGNALAPSSLIINDSVPYPVASSMYYDASRGYMGMKIIGEYDTTSTHSGLNPINFWFEIPNNLTSANRISLPTRGTGSYVNYPVYTLLKGGTQYVHIICDYGKLLSAINLKTSYLTDGSSYGPVADSIANNIPNMFWYEQ